MAYKSKRQTVKKNKVEPRKLSEYFPKKKDDSKVAGRRNVRKQATTRKKSTSMSRATRNLPK
jgi:hypothetical protein